MKETLFNKLVRDKIPSIIESSGRNCTFRSLGDEEFAAELVKKLREEVEEYIETPSSEELADILEVVFAIAEHSGITRETLEQIRASKAQERGAFRKKILLQQVAEL